MSRFGKDDSESFPTGSLQNRPNLYWFMEDVPPPPPTLRLLETPNRPLSRKEEASINPRIPYLPDHADSIFPPSTREEYIGASVNLQYDLGMSINGLLRPGQSTTTENILLEVCGGIYDRPPSFILCQDSNVLI